MKRGLVVGIVLLVVVTIGGIVLLTRDGAGDRSVPWHLLEEPPSTAGELKVFVLVGDGCNEFKTVEVDESDEQVRLTAVVHRSGAADCSSVMQTHQQTVRLAVPLGERELVGCKSRNGEACSEVPPSDG